MNPEERSQKFNKFAFAAYTNEEKNFKTNFAMSPASLQIALSTAYAGAEGNTAAEIAKVLNLDGNLKQDLENQKLFLKTLKDPSLLIATKIFVEERFKIKKDFSKTIENYLESEIAHVSFQADKASKTSLLINQWVSKKTNEKIQEIISSDDITPNLVLILINAVYFKAKWMDEFDPGDTKDDEFQVSLKEKIKVKMMYQNESHPYGDIDELKAKVVLKNYQGGKFFMLIILPRDIDGLKYSQEKISQMDLSELIKQLQTHDVVLRMPKFKIETQINFDQTMNKMGIKALFSDKADLKNIVDGPARISKVVQKVFLKVDEEGTEAAAATGMKMVLCSASLLPSAEFKVDRPFLILLCTETPLTIIFMAKILNPNKS